MALCWSLVYLQWFLVGQLLVQYAFTTGMIVVLLW